MSRIAVVYWSGTGNTQAMAEAVAQGAQVQGGDVSLFSCEQFSPAAIESYDSLAFGCPAMGAEVLEEEEFQPLWDACQEKLAGKKVALFGSYGWGDGEWMRSWEASCLSAGITLTAESVICHETPDEDSLADCKALGASLV